VRILERAADLTEQVRALLLAALETELLLPLAVKDKLIGFMSLAPKLSGEPYTGSDLRLLKSLAAPTGLDRTTRAARRLRSPEKFPSRHGLLTEWAGRDMVFKQAARGSGHCYSGRSWPLSRATDTAPSARRESGVQR
jgi:hypothetical protein